jgi:hypothetical protein
METDKIGSSCPRGNRTGEGERGRKREERRDVEMKEENVEGREPTRE